MYAGPPAVPYSQRRLWSQLHHRLGPKQVVQLSASGWLRRIRLGVYLPPGDELNRDAALGWLTSELPGLHIAGKTPLARRGVRNSLPFGERLVICGDKSATLPAWFTPTYPASYQATHLFDDAPS